MYIPTCFTSVNFFFSFFFFHPDPSSHPCQACPTMANRDPVRQKRGKAKKPIPDALLSGSEYDYQDEDVQSTTSIAGSQEAFGEQHNTTVVPQPHYGEAKAKEAFSLTEAMKLMWSMLEREDRQNEQDYQDRKEILEREDRQKVREEREQEHEITNAKRCNGRLT